MELLILWLGVGIPLVIAALILFHKMRKEEALEADLAQKAGVNQHVS